LPPLLDCGIQCYRSSDASADYFFNFRESDDSFVIGLSSGLQKVATRQDTPVDKAVMVYNASQYRLDTNSSYTVHQQILQTSHMWTHKLQQKDLH
jgi:hypothetical protein